MPCVVALMINLALASTAGLVFHLLWHWQYRSGSQSGSPVRKAAAVTLPPTGDGLRGVAGNHQCIYYGPAFGDNPVFAAVVVVLLVLRDPRVELANRDRRLMHQCTFVVGFLSTLVGMGVIVALYVSPDYPAVLPDHNLVGQWEIDFEELGVTREEALERLNLGYALHGGVGDGVHVPGGVGEAGGVDTPGWEGRGPGSTVTVLFRFAGWAGLF